MQRRSKYIFIVIVVLLLTAAVVFGIFKVLDNPDNSHSNNNVDEPENKYVFPIKNILNDSEELKKEHCLDNLCINDLVIDYYENGDSLISGKVVNKSKNSIYACFKIHFEMFDGSTDDFKQCVGSLKANEEVTLEISFTKDQEYLIDAVSYELLSLTPQEKAEIENSK